MVDQLEPEFVGDPFFHTLKIFGDEFENLAGLDIDQMMVMFVIHLETSKILIEIVPLHEIQLIQQMKRSIYRRNADG